MRSGKHEDRYHYNGEVLVNGAVCTQRGRKIRPGDRVDYHGLILGVAYADQ